MKTSTVGTLAWALIYGGLLIACVGIAVQRSGGALGTPLLMGGGVVAAVGFSLIYVRSRMKGD